ncbi:MAG TPA: aminotransferase class I/II-fold pyridoxal phosphate-dependent enzyme, partial [Polyangiaceae bacterium]|nr:aminotransferase class I/II-fold pyridoxal phosphate-dependent enzyme [Polyangiaceae bacterium]
AVPGLRLGYCVLPPSWAERLEAERPPWSVNAAAQAAVRVACDPSVTSFVQRSKERLRSDRIFLHEQLEQLGLRVHTSVAPYCLAKLPEPLTATVVRSELLEQHRVLVRDATSFCLPGHVRVAARPPEQALRLVSALRSTLGRSTLGRTRHGS